MRVLVAEDDPKLGPLIQKGLAAQGYAVDLRANGDMALQMIFSVQYDVVVLDILLPETNGLEICRRMRAANIATPAMLLTARGGIEHRIEGLDSGADDYMEKPFDFRELEARLRALLRRNGPTKSTLLQFGDIVMDTATRDVKRGSRLIQLSSKEFALLEYFLRHPRQALSRTHIIEHVWNFDADIFSNVVDVYVKTLRRKLTEDGEPDVIYTVRGVGYQMKDPAL